MGHRRGKLKRTTGIFKSVFYLFFHNFIPTHNVSHPKPLPFSLEILSRRPLSSQRQRIHKKFIKKKKRREKYWLIWDIYN